MASSVKEGGLGGRIGDLAGDLCEIEGGPSAGAASPTVTHPEVAMASGPRDEEGNGEPNGEPNGGNPRYPDPGTVGAGRARGAAETAELKTKRFSKGIKKKGGKKIQGRREK